MKPKNVIISALIIATIYVLYKKAQKKNKAKPISSSPQPSTNWTGNILAMEDIKCKPPVYIPAYNEYYDQYGRKGQQIKF